MAWKSYRDGSRTNWGTNNDVLTIEQINCGALLRIADASEAMAREYNRLISENQHLKSRVLSRNAEIERLLKQRSALRGVVTRLKKRLAPGASHD